MDQRHRACAREDALIFAAREGGDPSEARFCQPRLPALGDRGARLSGDQGADPHDTALYRQRHKIEIMFGRLKDWRRIHTRYDRCAHTFMSAIAIPTVIFWLNQ